MSDFNEHASSPASRSGTTVTRAIDDARDPYIEANQRLFWERYARSQKGRAHLQKSLLESDSTQDKVKIKIPLNTFKIPHLHYVKTGISDHVLVGNGLFNVGDLLPRPKGGSGGSGQGQGAGNGDAESIEVEEYRRVLEEIGFDDYELPNKDDRKASDEVIETYRAGFSTTGSPQNVSVLETVKKATARRIACMQFESEEDEKRYHELNDEFIMLNDKLSLTDDEKERLLYLESEINRYKEEHEFYVPDFDNSDLKYRGIATRTRPISKAVLFCLMDISGSMGAKEKFSSQTFFNRMRSFITTKYPDVAETVYVQHHTTAKEITEAEFFAIRETGGTLVSSAFSKVNEILEDPERYDPEKWNVYVCYASDGDNFTEDNENLISAVRKLMPRAQYLTYINVCASRNSSRDEVLPILIQATSNQPEKFQHAVVPNPKAAFAAFDKFFRKK